VLRHYDYKITKQKKNLLDGEGFYLTNSYRRKHDACIYIIVDIGVEKKEKVDKFFFY